jgi:hypothetical protein
MNANRKFSVTQLLSYSDLIKALSRSRLEGYSVQGDADSIDAVSRYVWNMRLASAFLPVLHLVEVSFRNALYVTGTHSTRNRRLTFRNRIACWLDAEENGVPLLEQGEVREVNAAAIRLGRDHRRKSAGHLVGQLTFGFWVQLCNAPYEQGRRSGPQLWPAAAAAFPGCPKKKRHREAIRRLFNDIRIFRNRALHHAPLWDQHLTVENERLLEALSWMNQDLSSAAQHHCAIARLISDGHAPHRDLAANLMRFG